MEKMGYSKASNVYRDFQKNKRAFFRVSAVDLKSRSTGRGILGARDVHN